MAVTVTPFCFPCAGETLVGMLHCPESHRGTAVVIVVGGPQYRVGGHRQFVRLARVLADAGYPVLRFDCRGMGDSSGEFPGFQSIGPDIGAAIDALQRQVGGIERIAAWGLCDAASSLMLNACNEPRIAALTLVNPWVRTAESLARARLKHYYLARLTDWAFWRKMLHGGFDFRDSATSLMGALRAAIFGGGNGAEGDAPAKNANGKRDEGAALGFADPDLVDRMADGLGTFPGPILLLLSGNDLTAREFEGAAASRRWRRLFEASRLTRRDIPAADHTFSRISCAVEAEAATLSWLENLKRS